MENIGIGSNEIRTNTNIYPLQSVFDFYNDLGEINCSSGFMELLSVQNFMNPPPSLFDTASLQQTEVNPSMCVEKTTAANKAELLSSDVLNPPATPNSSSISSASSEAANEVQVKADCDDDDEQEEDLQQKIRGTNKQLKPKKTSQKRQREARVAFMTRSEVDHLEDGYRWRKYGQKAVKNSPFPRSYYRCTTASCNVKKRVERSFSDPSIVVTTYEGQHTHPSPVIPRPSFCSRSGAFLGPSNSAGGFHLPMQQTSSTFPHNQQLLLFNQQQHHHQTSLGNPYINLMGNGYVSDGRVCNTAGSGLIKDNGLLQDVIPSHMLKEE